MLPQQQQSMTSKEEESSNDDLFVLEDLEQHHLSWEVDMEAIRSQLC